MKNGPIRIIIIVATAIAAIGKSILETAPKAKK
jgi:hypothetical protein